MTLTTLTTCLARRSDAAERKEAEQNRNEELAIADAVDGSQDVDRSASPTKNSNFAFVLYKRRI